VNPLLPLTGDQQVQIRIFQVKALAEMEIRQGALEEIDTAAQMYLMPDQVLEPAFFPRLDDTVYDTVMRSARTASSNALSIFPVSRNRGR